MTPLYDYTTNGASSELWHPLEHNAVRVVEVVGAAEGGAHGGDQVFALLRDQFGPQATVILATRMSPCGTSTEKALPFSS